MTTAEIETHLPTVRYWARHYSQRSHQTLDFEDLMVVGLMGLMDAARRYNPKRDVLFKTYAEFRIRGEIIDELRRQDWMSRGERRKQKIYRHAQHDLEQTLGRGATRQELARVLPFKGQELDRIHQYEQQETLQRYEEGDGVMMENSRDDVVEVILKRDEVRELLTVLPQVHRMVVERRYFMDAPLALIAQEVGLSEGRISQIHTEALHMLRQAAAKDLMIAA